MRKPRPLGLICAGRADHLAVARLPRVAEQLGPVKAPSFRLASRISNTLRSGYPVRNLADIAECRLLLVCVADRSVKRLVEELTHASIRWNGISVVLVSCGLDSSELRPLALLGADVASLHLPAVPDGQRFLAEGDRSVLRELRDLLPPGSRLLEISTEAKQLCLAGISMATTALTPIIDAAVGCMTGSGLSARESVALVERLMQNTLRGYVKSGRKSWEGVLAAKDWPAVHRQLEAVSARDPDLSKWFEQGARHAVSRLHKGSELPLQGRHKSAG